MKKSKRAEFITISKKSILFNGKQSLCVTHYWLWLIWNAWVLVQAPKRKHANTAVPEHEEQNTLKVMHQDHKK